MPNDNPFTPHLGVGIRPTRSTQDAIQGRNMMPPRTSHSASAAVEHDTPMDTATTGQPTAQTEPAPSTPPPSKTDAQQLLLPQRQTSITTPTGMKKQQMHAQQEAMRSFTTGATSAQITHISQIAGSAARSGIAQQIRVPGSRVIT